MTMVFESLSARMIAEQRLYKMAVIFDIDGVMSDPNHRLNLLDQTPPDWEGFFSLCGDDPVHHHNVVLVRTLLQTGMRIFFVTGRPERTRQTTLKWFRQMAALGFEDFTLYMRANGDYRPDYVIKREVVQEIRKAGLTIIMAFDDRKQVADMYKEEGIPCHLVDAGAPNMEQVAKYEKANKEEGDTAAAPAAAEAHG